MAKKSKWYDNAALRLLTPLGSGKGLGRRGFDTATFLGSLAAMPWPFKEGGRVTKHRGCGIAKRGFGRAMRKK
jgi:hypothetical protein